MTDRELMISKKSIYFRLEKLIHQKHLNFKISSKVVDFIMIELELRIYLKQYSDCYFVLLRFDPVNRLCIVDQEVDGYKIAYVIKTEVDRQIFPSLSNRAIAKLILRKAKEIWSKTP